VRLKQVLNNLLSNAIKFTEKGHIKLEVEFIHNFGNNGSLKFTVTDTGTGFPPAKNTTIFEAFKQADDLTTRYRYNQQC
jgi:signal transduction histidine kinase